MEKKMETTIWELYRGYIGIMEKKMETTIIWGVAREQIFGRRILSPR